MRVAETSGEYAETWRIARCGGDERREQDEGFSRCGATPFLLAEKTNYEMSRQKMRIGWKLKNDTPNLSVQLGALNSETMIYTG